MEDFPEFLSRTWGRGGWRSLPHFTGTSVDRVRGKGAFEKSLRVLRQFNDLGYGKEGTGLILNLVYNPPGALMSGSQKELEKRYHQELAIQGVYFNSLFTFANMPLGRFREFLVRNRGFDSYMAAIRRAFNPATLDGLMCRYLVCVRWRMHPFRLRFQPGSGAARRGVLPPPHLRLQSREICPPPHHHRRSLLRLHRRRRRELTGRDRVTGRVPAPSHPHEALPPKGLFSLISRDISYKSVRVQTKRRDECMNIRYYSTNRNLDGIEGIVPFKGSVTFGEALLQGQAPDEGLFMPDAVPFFRPTKSCRSRGRRTPSARCWWRTPSWARKFHGMRFAVSWRIPTIFPFLWSRSSTAGTSCGLTGAPRPGFKDFAARMMARLMSYFRDEGKKLNVLVATSGDTGSAVGEAFKGVPGIGVYILYPRNEVSGMQKKQLDTIGKNVRSLSIDGKFDDCQNLVKQAFADPSLVKLNLTSANSINFGRILPQMVYYVYAYAQLAWHGDEEVVFSVPSGNFGNALGCEYARRMGIPVRKLLMPVNENDEFPRFLESGVYEKVSPLRACLSNAMNVGDPSNLARFFDLYGRDGGPPGEGLREAKSGRDEKADLLCERIRHCDEGYYQRCLRKVRCPPGASWCRELEGARGLPGEGGRLPLCVSSNGTPGQVPR